MLSENESLRRCSNSNNDNNFNGSVDNRAQRMCIASFPVVTDEKGQKGAAGPSSAVGGEIATKTTTTTTTTKEAVGDDDDDTRNNGATSRSDGFGGDGATAAAGCKLAWWPTCPRPLRRRSHTAAAGARRSGPKRCREERWTWDLDTIRLTPPPSYGRPGRRHTSVEVALPLETVVNRMVRFARSMSIACTFHRNEARVTCVAPPPGMLSFEVDLWNEEGGDDVSTEKKQEQSESPDIIVVEVRRLGGCAIEMQYIRRILFRAIQSNHGDGEDYGEAHDDDSNNNDDAPRVAHGATAPCSPGHITCVSPGTNERRQWDDDRCRREGMRCVWELLESDFADQNRLGLESLKCLTDTSFVSRTTALCVSRALIREESGDHGGLRRAFLSHFRAPSAWAVADAESSVGDDADVVGTCRRALDAIFDDDDDDDDARSRDDMLHSLALTVLAGALDNVKNDDNKKDAAPAESAFFFDRDDDDDDDARRDSYWRTISNALVWNMTRAVLRPQEAAMSARCMNLLEDMHSSSAAATMLHDDDGDDATATLFDYDRLLPHLLEALNYGKSHHLDLERHTQALILRLAS